jgi:uncharacterized small protein (DUF1192 family)
MPMAIFEEDLPRKKPAHELGQDLSLLSLKEIDERVALLEAEIERLKQARQAKDATKSAADALFRKG